MDNPNFVLPDDKAALWITGYFPNGFRASFTVAVNLQTAFAEGMEFTSRLAAQGFTMNVPGLEDGEDRFFAARVVRREKFDEHRNRMVPILDLYTDHGKFRELGVYLNMPEDETAFEQAAGIKLASLPLCENDAPFKLDGDLSKANRYLRPLPQPLGVVREPNPGYVEGGDTKKSKWKFVRWDTGTPTAPASVPTAPPAQTVNGNPPPVELDWNKVIAKAGDLHKSPPQERFNTVNAMKTDGSFTGVTTVEAAAALVVERLKKHREESGKQLEDIPF